MSAFCMKCANIGICKIILINLMLLTGCSSIEKSGCFMDSFSFDRDVPACSFYASFDCGEGFGEEHLFVNEGCVGYGQSALTGEKGKHRPGIRTDGIKGCAYDGRMMGEKSFENAPQWGMEGKGGELGEAINNARCFTVSLWLNTSKKYDQGRIFKTPAFQVNYRGDYLELGFGKPKEWYSSDVSTGNFASQENWVFAAITFESGNGGDNKLIYYFGTEDRPVETDSIVFVEEELSGCFNNSCFLVVGNSESEGNRPFVGSIDEFRLWLGPDKDGAVLSGAQLELIRRYDLGDLD